MPTPLGNLRISVPDAFAFSRLNLRANTFLVSMMLATMIVSGFVIPAPKYTMLSRLGRLNTWAVVIIPSLPATAFSVFLFRQSMLSLPQDLIDAAKLDGAIPPPTIRNHAIIYACRW